VDERINQLIERVQQLENFIDGQQAMTGLVGSNERAVFTNKQDFIGASIRADVPLLNRLQQLESVVENLEKRIVTTRGEALTWLGW
jgi:hypothetical protein